ncbi:metal-sensing transcriptional repressor [Achromobacter animicus]|uniref:metal-sensing transcriptional repressor n=1 Tax=Achromobacter animicus TaxID=1389935 RepID=UPI00244CFD5F|nr:metal-sensing transcriptional repressor [Achromobacter animicus]MDH0682750.1 metal-sensing transcriptional repressor [Achromobacter animicus]
MTDSSTPHLHHHHDAVSKRLKRAEGHLRSILQMMADDRPCLEVAQQLHAVERAISQAKKVLIQDHIDHCLESAIGQVSPAAQRSVEEFKEITKYL